jgi:acetoin utilization protein AcuB
MSNNPPISEYMTPTPATVSTDLTLADAMDRMFADNIRHLPVVNDVGRLVGMLSTRDIAVTASLRGMDPAKLTVEAAMSPAPYTCAADTPLSDVALAMEKDRLGSTIVTDDGKPIGMFTTTDAMRALRSAIAGKPVEAAVKPTHIVEEEQSDERRRVDHPRTHARQPSANAGTLSWFLGPL